MKELINILVILCLIKTSDAQSYEPIVNSNQDVEFNVCHPVFDGNIDERYRNKGDTIINGFEYTVIGSNFFQGYLRQNSTYSKAWFKEENSDEKLIMDLNMEIGDSIFIDCEMYGRRYSKAISIDTVNSRKVIELDYIYPRILATQTDTIKYRPLKFIEGIGTNGFLMYQIDDTGFHLYGFLLETVKKNGNIEYENLEDCEFPVSTKDLELYQIEIYPNPASNFIKIVNNGNHSITKMDILNISGKTIISKRSLQNIEKLDIQSLTQGLYILKMQIGKEIITKKIIVK